MSELRPCGECRRHVSIDEHACPFCGTAQAASPRVLALGRLSRAAVFASAALATTACGGKQKADPNVNNTGSGTQTQQTADAGMAETPPDPPDTTVKEPDHAIPMPYGAPPARRRVV